jgi:6-pyruvoyltetrahydropterin/6-carboxytetrahydropterin synthase
MFTLRKEFKFEASHILPDQGGKCARLHGHSWVGYIEVEGEKVQEGGRQDGMVQDYGDMKAPLKTLVANYLDHHHLNRTLGMKAPTSERVAAWIFEQLAPVIPGLVRVIIEETCTSRCEYDPGHQHLPLPNGSSLVTKGKPKGKVDKTGAKTYGIREIFYSVQGEGARAGTANIFVRFQGCNLNCSMRGPKDVEAGVPKPPLELDKPVSPGFAGQGAGFQCDTDWLTGDQMSGADILAKVQALGGKCRWVLFTGGEPSLQLDAALVRLFRSAGYQIAVESNGTGVLPPGLDWICVSPKTPPEMLKTLRANEVKYVIANGVLPPPIVPIEADHYLVSPAFDVESKTDIKAPGSVIESDLDACLRFVQDYPRWRLSVQSHKFWLVR